MTDEIRSYRDLVAWQRARELGLAIYRATQTFPKEERYGLAAQLRRGAVGIASNIAEGYGRGSRADYVRFLRIARGALFELETQLLFALDLGYVGAEQFDQLQHLVDETARPLSGLIRSIEESQQSR